MEQNVLGLPAGFRDVMFEEAEARRRIENEFAAVLGSSGYREIIPSGVEYLEVYERGKQGVHDRAIRFLDRDDNLLALRADFTPAIARIVAARLREVAPPLRLWYSGPVFRKTDRHRGRYQEFAQIGAELLGDASAAADGEIIEIALRCLERCALKDVRLHINHAGIFKGIVNSLGLLAGPLAEIRSAIDRKDMRALEMRLEELGVDGSSRAEVHALSRCVGDSQTLETASGAITNEESRAAIAELSALWRRLGRWQEKVVFDLAEIDEMEYYTGVMFTFLSPSHPDELGRGGRYDGLIREFGADMPAIGFSFSVDDLRGGL